MDKFYISVLVYILESRMVIKLIDGDDWQQLFVDGKLLTETHKLDAHDFIEALKLL